MEAKGVGGVVAFDGSTVTIDHRGFVGTLGSGGQRKSIPIAEVADVVLKPAGLLANGFIRFLTHRGGGGRWGRSTASTIGDADSLVFTRRQQRAFERLRDAVLAATGERPAAPAPTAGPSIPEQIAQLAELRDRGILTEEEFARKKAELLARM